MDNINQLVSINSDTILNSIADGVVVMGPDHKIIFVNRAAKELLKKAGVDNISTGRRCDRVIGHSDCSLSCLVNKAIKTGNHIYDHEVTLGGGNNKISLSVNTALLRDEKGNVIGGIEIFRDISLINELRDELKNRYSFDNIIGKNYRMHEVYKLLYQVSPTLATVLIEGESGTGKELIAHAIHHNSQRRSGPFIKLNCAALSENLLESELFGHVKGAFTGAISDRKGRFQMADGGSLFLDEIGEMRPHTQAKLLRALQEGEFERVGDTRTFKVDVRIIAATNRDLQQEVKKGNFREDLYYRLKVVPIQLPPLRERKDDIPALVNHFMSKLNQEMGFPVTNISPQAMDILLDYNYPGNIRELENILEYAFVRCRGKSILPKHLPGDITHEKYKADLIDKTVKEAEPLKELERETILRILDETNWKYTESAKRLGVGRTTLWRRMKEFDIEKERNTIGN